MTKPAVIMCLDQAPNNTGWAVGPIWETRPFFGKFTLPPWGDDEPARVKAYHHWLMSMLEKHDVSHLFYEMDVPRAGQGKAIMVANRSGGQRPIVVNQKDPNIQRNQDAVISQVWLAAALRGIPVAPIEVRDMRTRFLGSPSVAGLKGDALRKELKRRAVRSCALRGWLVEDDNVAEALGHFDFACSVLDPKHAGRGDILFRRAELNLWKGEKP